MLFDKIDNKMKSVFNCLGIVLGLLSLYFIVVCFMQHKPACGLLIAPIPGGMYTPNMQVFRRGLSRKLERLVVRYGKWAKFTQFIDVKKYKEAGTYAGGLSLPQPKNLITVVKDFEREGGIYMDTPVLAPLIAPGTVGTEGLRGKEEKRKILTKKVAVNQIRHAVEIQDSKMSKQMLRKPEIQMALMQRGMEDLQDWFSRRTAMFPYQAIMGNMSDNLTNPIYGLNFPIQSHPNSYVAGYGKVPFANVFNAAYETAMSNALATLVDDATHHFSMAQIRNLVYLFNWHLGIPMNIQGHMAPIIFIPPALAWQLIGDPEYRDALKFAQNRGDTNALWTGLLEGTFVEGAFLIMDDYVPSAYLNGDTNYDATIGTVHYGPYANSTPLYMSNPRDTGTRKAAVVVGAGCVSAGYASELGYESETADYQQFLGDAADTIMGFQRSDITDDDNYFGNGAGSFYQNATSLVMWFYAADQLTAI
jgi:hypothetical protein